MKNHGPTTQREITLPPDKMLVSKTDLKGKITYCNQDFIEASGFSEAELIGKNHNIVRHPEMPPEAFADLWQHLRAKKPWSGIVKNRAKNGDYYWVNANVIPVVKNGHVVEYMSVRFPATPPQIKNADETYRRVRQGQSKFRSKKSLISRCLNKVSTAQMLYGTVAAAAAMYGIIALMLVTGAPLNTLLTVLAIGPVLSLVGGIYVTRRCTRPLSYAVEKLEQIAEGHYTDWVHSDREDEFGQLLIAMRSMQTQLSFEVTSAKDQAIRTGRIKTALDCASANVMIADASDTIIYCNPSLLATFSQRESALKSLIPTFDSQHLLGKNMHDFHGETEAARAWTNAPNQAFTSSLSTENCQLTFTATPIFDRSLRIGTVMEWIDRTDQIAIESEVQSVVEGAQAGILNQRLSAQGQEGFFYKLSESINQLLNVNETVIAESSRSLAALASGDLTKRITGHYQGEFGQLKDNINASIEQLTGTIEQITFTASAVDNGLTAIVEGNNDLARRTDKQVSALERTASAMEEINDTIQQSAHHAVEANHMADKAKQHANEGGAVVSSAMEAMGAIRDANNNIQSITDLIDNIAFQTNLLALNAAVEAAHAADHGQGFGVVADEVRQLALKTSVAAREVQELIRNSLDKVQRGTEWVTQSGNILNEIIEQSASVSHMIEEISKASQEQAAGVKDISQHITQLDRATHANASLVQNTSEAGQCVLEKTHQLTAWVAHFKLPAGQHTKAASSVDEPYSAKAFG